MHRASCRLILRVSQDEYSRFGYASGASQYIHLLRPYAESGGFFLLSEGSKIFHSRSARSDMDVSYSESYARAVIYLLSEKSRLIFASHRDEHHRSVRISPRYILFRVRIGDA